MTYEGVEERDHIDLANERLWYIVASPLPFSYHARFHHILFVRYKDLLVTQSLKVQTYSFGAPERLPARQQRPPTCS